MRALVSAVAAVMVLALVACGSGDDQAREVAKLRNAFRQVGLSAQVVDRHAETAGPPTVRGCDPPVVAGGSDGAIATIYVCADSAHALSGKVPNYYPGRRLVRGRVVVVLDGPPSFAEEVTEVLRATVS